MIGLRLRIWAGILGKRLNCVVLSAIMNGQQGCCTGRIALPHRGETAHVQTLTRKLEKQIP